MKLGFEHTYVALPARFYERVVPTPVVEPRLIVFNAPLAAELGLDARAFEPEAAAVLSGNRLPEDAQPIAMAYAGHQFGGFVPSLGDGRAILLGELRGRDGVLRDLQLKGAGPTPYSRGGDGRAVVGPMLREYLVSEAMHALGIPTTRSLAVVATGESVYRDGALPGAVLARVAASHVRVGTFQYFAARGDTDALRELLGYVIARHYPAAREAANPALAVLAAVAGRQLTLVTAWMLVGFIHGVMNTDNMGLAGETLDYGPCAFMDTYDPKTVYSSIDHGGRYAYANQPLIAQWNLARLAEALLPLVDPDPETAVGLVTGTVTSFMARFDQRFLAGLCRKIGLATPTEDDTALVKRLLALMQAAQADFTLTFRRLAQVAADPGAASDLHALFAATGDFASWLQDWRARLARDDRTPAARAADMCAANPAFIPRNHRVQAALDAAERGDYAPLHRILGILRRPYEDQPDAGAFSGPPRPEERVLATYCGT